VGETDSGYDCDDNSAADNSSERNRACAIRTCTNEHFAD
jgi:hypothetical protein